MTITISSDTEARLRAKAETEGRDPNEVADALLMQALEWDMEDSAQAQEGVRRGLADVAAGRTRPFVEFAAEQRQKHGLEEPT